MAKSNVRNVVENAIREQVAAAVAGDHMTANATPKATYNRITVDRVADIMEALPFNKVVSGEAEQDAREQAQGIIDMLEAVPHREPGRGGTYTYTFTSDSRMKVSPDNTGWFLKNIAGAAVTFAFREAERAAKDFTAYRTRTLLEREARSDTAEGIDGDRDLTALAQAEERAITSITSARLAWILASFLSDWTAKVTDGEPAQGSERIAPQEGPAPKKGARPTGILD